MEAGGAMPAGSGRTVRLDPFALPVRFPAKDAGADGQMRQVELDRDRVVLRRAVRGMRMKIRLAGRGIRRHHAGDSSDASGNTASVILDHCDPGLSVPLLDDTALDDAAADLARLGPGARPVAVAAAIRMATSRWCRPAAAR